MLVPAAATPASVSQGLHAPLQERVARALKDHAIEAVVWLEVSDTDIGSAARCFADLPGKAHAVVGVGAIVTENVPPRSVVMGNPARLVASF